MPRKKQRRGTYLCTFTTTDGRRLFDHAVGHIPPVGERFRLEGPRGRFTEYEVAETSVGTDLRLRFVGAYRD